jgi:hypothetical protein
MKKTVGTADRIVRGVLAIVALIFAGVAGFSSGWGIVLTIVAAILIVTGATAYCPLYSATGISTVGEGERHHRGAGAH